MDIPITSVARAISALTDRAHRSHDAAQHLRTHASGYPMGPDAARVKAEAMEADVRRDEMARDDLLRLRGYLEGARDAAVDAENAAT